MFGRNGAKSRPARNTRAEAAPRAIPDASAAPSTLLAIVGQQSQGGFFNGNVAKIREQDAHAGVRPVHLVEDMRQGAQK